MGGFTNEFFNITEGPVAMQASPGDLRNRELIRQRIVAASTGGPLGMGVGSVPGGRAAGGIVYIPPGRFRIQRQTDMGRGLSYPQRFLTPDLDVLPNVTLMFAPGAILVLEPEVVVRFQGMLEAQPFGIFEIEQPPAGSGLERARVVFLAEAKVPELFPEWWGATPSVNTMSRESTDAVQDCLDAARRLFVLRDDGSVDLLPTIPVRFLNTYGITREIVLDGGTSVVIRGRRGVATTGGGDQPSLRATREFPVGSGDLQGRALLRFNGVHGALVEGVVFNADGFAPTCVQITGNNAKLNVFRECTFLNAKDQLVQLGDYVLYDSDPTNGVSVPSPSTTPQVVPWRAEVSRDNWDLSNLVFRNCVFDMVPQSPRVQGMHRVAVVFSANNAFPVCIENCNVGGPAAAYIIAYGGTMLIRGCTFHNSQGRPLVGSNRKRLLSQMTATNRFPGVLMRPGGYPGDTRMVDLPQGGVDIFLADPLVRQQRGMPRHVLEATAVTGLTMEHCESQSHQLLDSFYHISASGGRVVPLPTVLQGVHTNSTFEGPAPPAIEWVGPGWMSNPGPTSPMMGQPGRGSSLTLIGCIFGGVLRTADIRNVTTPETNPPSGVVVVGSLSFLVGDVGTRLAGRTESVEVFSEFQVFAHQYRPVPIMGMTGTSIAREFPWLRRM